MPDVCGGKVTKNMISVIMSAAAASAMSLDLVIFAYHKVLF